MPFGVGLSDFCSPLCRSICLALWERQDGLDHMSLYRMASLILAGLRLELDHFMRGLRLKFYGFSYSIKDRKRYLDTTGDPWNGRTLEWSIPSPPPIYNFAIIPQLTSSILSGPLNRGQAPKPTNLNMKISICPKTLLWGFISEFSASFSALP